MENNTKYYMLRTKDTPDHNSTGNNYVNIGWGKVDLTKGNTDFNKIKDNICKIYLENKNPTVKGRTLNQIKRFIEIKKGDILVIPYNSSVRFATVIEKSYANEEYGNRIKVDFFNNAQNKPINIPRRELSEKLQRRLRTRGITVADYQEFAEEINKITSTKNYSYSENIEKRINTDTEKFKDKLLSRIKEGSTHLESGGLGLERLVKELLEIDGYTAEILPKNKFGNRIADADIRAMKNDFLIGEFVVLIQIKHHNGTTDNYGVNQLKDISNTDYYYDYRVLITTGEVSEEVIQEASNSNIRIIEGKDFIDWVYDDLNNLSINTRFKLGISNIPEFL